MDDAGHAERPDGNVRRVALSSAVFGGLMVLGAILVIVDASRLPATESPIGPAVVPIAVGCLLGAVGLGIVLRSVTQLRGSASAQPSTRSAWRVLALVAAFVVFALLLPVLGYVVSSAALFVAAALLLGAPRGWHVVAYGWSLAGLAFLVFDRLIGLTLPAGPWGF